MQISGFPPILPPAPAVGILRQKVARFGVGCEGIETVADLQAMQIMGCDFGQGNLIAPPMPQADFMALLQQRMNKPRPKAAPAEGAGDAGPAAASA